MGVGAPNAISFYAILCCGYVQIARVLLHFRGWKYIRDGYALISIIEYIECKDYYLTVFIFLFLLFRILLIVL